MKQDMRMSDGIVSILAFFQRAIQRTLRQRRDTFGRKVAARSAAYLRDLQAPCASLRFRLALKNLRYDADLLYEEAVSVPAALELQARIVELAKTEPDAERLVQWIIEPQAPIFKVFAAILVQAANEGASKIRITFRPDEDKSVLIHTLNGAEKEILTIPQSLSTALRGYLLRIERLGYDKFRPHMSARGQLPSAIFFSWPDPSVLEIDIDLSTTAEKVRRR